VTSIDLFFLICAILGYAFLVWSSKKVLIGRRVTRERAALGEAFGLENMKRLDDNESFRAERAALLKAYAENSIPFVRTQRNPAWCKWSKRAKP
jgi:hypothetical protein